MDNLFDLLIIDIETVPKVPSFENLSENWKELWIEKVSKTMPELDSQDSFKKKAGILAEFGKIICISVAYFLENEKKELCLKVKNVSGHNEKEVLEGFIKITNQFQKKFKQFQFAGHNIREFDIPFICRRMIVNQISLPEYFKLQEKKPWEIKMLDTLSWWKFGDYKNFTSLHLLANVLGIPTSKIDMDGSQVQEVYYVENNLNRIVEYCNLDVQVVANIILRFKNVDILTADKIKTV